jgi:hypothetical protein
LIFEARCPFCQRKYRHGWLVEYGLTGIGRRAAHCGTPDSPFAKSGYYIGLSAIYDSESERILARFPRRR